MPKPLKLKRAIGLTLLTLYGLGNILGAGIYVLIGKVAGAAGYLAPISFLIALMVAALTAFSYMELSSRFPKNAAVPVYLFRSFKIPWLSTATGLLLVAAGLVSAATLAKGFVGYLALFLALPEWLIVVGVISILTLFAVAGISQSAKLAALFTVAEIVGLLMVVASSIPYLGNATTLLSHFEISALFGPGVLIGSFLAFYAFIGFEDMIEIIEEVKNPTKVMPKAILLSLIISSALYILVIVAALLVKTPESLSQSSAPLADVFAAATGKSPLILAGIGLAAILNGILVQIIMGARVLYGLGAQGWIHKSFSGLNKRTKTPALTTVLLSAIIIVSALSLPLVQLAGLTSMLVLAVFAMVNASLIVLKLSSNKPGAHYRTGFWVPVLGLITTIGMLLAALLLGA